MKKVAQNNGRCLLMPYLLLITLLRKRMPDYAKKACALYRSPLEPRMRERGFLF